MAERDAVLLSPATVKPWAAEVLEAPPGADADAVARAAIERLASAGWKPPASLRFALEIAALPHEGGDRISGGPAAFCYLQAEQQQRSRVEDFAEKFFTLAPAERTERWTALWKESAAFPAVHDRLTRLKPGLPVTLPTCEDAKLQQLCDAAAAWFVARPNSRAVARQKVDEILGPLVSERVKLVARFRLIAARFSSLVPALFDELPTPTRQFEAAHSHAWWRDFQLEQAAAPAPVVRTEQHADEDYDEQPARRRSSHGRSSRKSAWIGSGAAWVVIIVVVNAIRFLANSSPQKSPSIPLNYSDPGTYSQFKTYPANIPTNAPLMPRQPLDLALPNKPSAPSPYFGTPEPSTASSPFVVVPPIQIPVTGNLAAPPPKVQTLERQIQDILNRDGNVPKGFPP